MKSSNSGPGEVDVREIDDLIVRGYVVAARKGQAWASYGKASADLWLKAWEKVKRRLPADPFNLDREMELFAGLRQPLFNWLPDVDDALMNAGNKDPAYRPVRKIFCEEVMARLVVSNHGSLFRRSHALTLWQLGQHEEAEQKIQDLIAEEPRDAWNWIAWGDFYSFEKPHDLHRAENVYRRALEQPSVREREAIIERLAMVEDMRKEECAPAPGPSTLPQESGRRPSGKAGKVGRNDPCPCGSGKKYKKCCLR